MDQGARPQNRGQGSPGHWGKWRGVECSAEGCDKPARCRGFCSSHYNKHLWASGHRSPSVNAASRYKARIKHRYGIDKEEFDRMFAEQGGCCAICRQPPGENVRAHWGGKLCIDHCHDTGKSRGLLCNDCNLAIGYIADPAVLERAAEYLRLHDRPDP